MSRPEAHTCIIPGPCCCLELSWLASHSQGSPDWLLAEQVSSPQFSSSCWRLLLPSSACCWRWPGRLPTLRRYLPASRFSSPLHLSYHLLHWMLLVCLEVFCFWGTDHLPAQSKHSLSSCAIKTNRKASPCTDLSYQYWTFGSICHILILFRFPLTTTT